MARVSRGDEAEETVGRVGAMANFNLKVTEDEKWAFKEWCANQRTSQVDAFRRGLGFWDGKG